MVSMGLWLTQHAEAVELQWVDWNLSVINSLNEQMEAEVDFFCRGNVQ